MNKPLIRPRRVLNTPIKRGTPEQHLEREGIVASSMKNLQQQFVRPPVVDYANPHSVINSRRNDTINVNVETWADVDRSTFPCWGDYWVKVELYRAFKKLGANVNVAPKDADLTIYLYGSPFPQNSNWPYGYNPHSFNLAWFYSHPDSMTIAEMRKYDLICCASRQYLQHSKMVKATNVHPQQFQMCTNFTVPERTIEELQTDICFVGNARGGLEYGRLAVLWLKDINPKYKISIYGSKWEQQRFHSWVKPHWIKGRYFVYDRLNEMYNAAKIVLIDGHKDMFENGFLSTKLHDVFASGGFPIIYHNTSVQEAFGDFVPMFKTQAEMFELIERYCDDIGAREKIIEQGRAIAIKDSYDVRALQFLKAHHEHSN